MMPLSGQHGVDDQTLRAYLFGELTAERAEQFDEWSVVDDEFSARLHTVESDLVDAYVRGELSGDTLAKFRTVYLSSLKRRERVAFAEGLQARVAPRPVPRSVEKEARTPWWAFLSFPRLAFVGGLAMTFAIGALLFNNLQLRNAMQHAETDRAALQQKEQSLETQLQNEHASNAKTIRELEQVRNSLAQLQTGVAKHASQLSSLPVNVVAFVLAPQLRGATHVPTFKVPQGTTRIDLRLELEGNDYPHYRADLKTAQDEKTLWHSAPLRVTKKGESSTLSVSIPANLLGPQIYQLDLTGTPATGGGDLVSSYVFRVVTQ